MKARVPDESHISESRSGAPRFRYRVEAALGEGMAAGEPFEGKPGAFSEAEAVERYVGIFAAGGKVEALGGADRVGDG